MRNNLQAQGKMFRSAIRTPIGPMLAVADDGHLLLLEFMERKNLRNELGRLERMCSAIIAPGVNDILMQVAAELKSYFDGELRSFSTPYKTSGTEFQEQVWCQLKDIPYGETISYSVLAQKIGRPRIFRAVAGASSYNQLAIIIPCHRVISIDGSAGGYAGGAGRKEYLLDMEMRNSKN